MNSIKPRCIVCREERREVIEAKVREYIPRLGFKKDLGAYSKSPREGVLARIISSAPFLRFDMLAGDNVVVREKKTQIPLLTSDGEVDVLLKAFFDTIDDELKKGLEAADRMEKDNEIVGT